MSEVVRVNTRISKKLNDWLDKQSNETGIPKSSLITISVENYYKETEVLQKMSDMDMLAREIKKLNEVVSELATKNDKQD